ncbi:DoxX family protein [Streptomyces sp. NPDC055681]
MDRRRPAGRSVAAAARGLAVLMAGAAVVHGRRKEPQMIAVNALPLALAVVVAWGRLGPYAF